MRRSAGGACGAGAAAGEEARLCAMAQTKRKPNYHAARQCATAIYCLAAAVVAMDRGWAFGGSSQSSVECPWRRAAGAPTWIPTPDVRRKSGDQSKANVHHPHLGPRTLCSDLQNLEPNSDPLGAWTPYNCKFQCSEDLRSPLTCIRLYTVYLFLKRFEKVRVGFPLKTFPVPLEAAFVHRYE